MGWERPVGQTCFLTEKSLFSFWSAPYVAGCMQPTFLVLFIVLTNVLGASGPLAEPFIKLSSFPIRLLESCWLGCGVGFVEDISFCLIWPPEKIVRF